MGSVWVAHHVKLASRFAIKFIDPRLAASDEVLERFEREARATAALQSHHVIQVLDYGVDGGTPYLVMELLQGEDLGARLRRLKRLTLAEAVSIAVQVGKALRRAHEAGIVHRDLKPANLFLTRVENDEIVKVLDFGIAKETGCPAGDTTKTGAVMGSPHYMSPEQARAEKDVDHRTDLWALGVILYRSITGALPFPGDGLLDILSHIVTDPVPPVASVAPDLPASLDAFFAKALAKAKEQRFQSVGELVDGFVQAAGQAPLISGVSALEAPTPAGSPGLPAGTLAFANTASAPGVKPPRSIVLWLAAAGLALVLVGAAAFGWYRMQSSKTSGSAEPDAMKASPSLSVITSAEPKAREAPMITEAPASEAPSAPAAPPSSQRPVERRRGSPAPRPKQTSEGGWGF